METGVRLYVLVPIALITTLLYSLPIWLAIAAFHDGVTVVPDSREELLLAGGLIVFGFIPLYLREAKVILEDR